jgi:hypothetical protein
MQHTEEMRNEYKILVVKPEGQRPSAKDKRMWIG